MNYNHIKIINFKKSLKKKDQIRCQAPEDSGPHFPIHSVLCIAAVPWAL